MEVFSAFGAIPAKRRHTDTWLPAEGGNLYTVVNASQEKAKVMLPEATGTGRVLFTDSGFMPVLEKNIVELGPNRWLLSDTASSVPGV